MEYKSALDYLNELGEQLVKPISSYQTKGSYNFRGRENPYAALIHVGANGNFVGDIYSDPNSVGKIATMMGEFTRNNGTVEIKFEKRYLNPFLDPLVYHYKKTDNSTEHIGNYVGTWSFIDTVAKVRSTKEIETEPLKNWERPTRDIIELEKRNSTKLEICKIV